MAETGGGDWGRGGDWWWGLGTRWRLVEGTGDEVVTVVKGDVVALEVEGVLEVLGQPVEEGEGRPRRKELPTR